MERAARPAAFGERRGVIKITFTDRPVNKRHYWFVNESDRTELCIDDPGLTGGRIRNHDVERPDLRMAG